MTTERISAIKKFQNSDAKVRFNSVVYCSVKERVLIDNPVWPLKRPVASELEAVYPKGVLGSRTPGSPLLCAGVGSYLNNVKLGPPEALPCRRRNLHSSLASPKRCPAWWLAVPPGGSLSRTRPPPSPPVHCGAEDRGCACARSAQAHTAPRSEQPGNAFLSVWPLVCPRPFPGAGSGHPCFTQTVFVFFSDLAATAQVPPRGLGFGF